MEYQKAMFESFYEYAGIFIESAIGGFWLFALFCFILFFVYYFRYYHLAHRCNLKAYKMAYKDLDKIARNIAVAFMMFIGMTITFCLESYDPFLDCLKKGFVLNIMCSPIYYYIFGDEKEFKLKRY